MSSRRQRRSARWQESCVGEGYRTRGECGRLRCGDVYVVDAAALAAPLPQPRVDALEARGRNRRRRDASCSPPRCSRPTWRQASPLGSRRASTGTSPTLRSRTASSWDKARARGHRRGRCRLDEPDAHRACSLRRLRARWRPGGCGVARRAGSRAGLLGGRPMVEQAHEQASGPSIEDADMIVAGGRGLGAPEGIRLAEELAAALGGAVGATRAVVDAGWYPTRRRSARPASR